MNILIINGANLNLLGTREPNIYGKQSMQDYLESIQDELSGIQLDYFQSNIEGEIINRIQHEDYDALIINPGAYTHYSYAIYDALKNTSKTKLEVHISNIYQRETFRQKSVTAAACNGVISGFGMHGYLMAIQSLTH